MNSTTLNMDSVKAYLHEIGQIPLLTPEAEITYGNAVKQMMQLQAIRADGRRAGVARRLRHSLRPAV
jgi:RNA polymerase nonessential primary-like sigma factor